MKYECAEAMLAWSYTIQHILDFVAAVLLKTVCDDYLSPLVEFNDHEKTHMHYHLRRDADYC